MFRLGDHTLPNLLLCSSIFQMNIIWVSWCVVPTISLWLFCLCNPLMILIFLCYLTFKRWCYRVYITSKCYKFMDARILPYHSKWGDMLSRALCIMHLWTSVDVSTAHHHLFSCQLLSRRAYITILWMLLLFLSLFPLCQYASPLVVSMDILNSSTSNFVTSV